MAVEAERDRGVDRLVTFADAIIAIAITLLALPLVDLPQEYTASLADGATESLGDLLGEMALPAFGLLISFFVIARLWWAHHRVFEHVVRVTTPLVALTVCWLFTVVVFAVATAISTSFSPQQHPEVVALYIGVLVVASLILTVMSQIVLRHPEITDGHDDGAFARAFVSAETSISFVLALVIGVAFPAVNFFALGMLAVTGRLGAQILRRLERRR